MKSRILQKSIAVVMAAMLLMTISLVGCTFKKGTASGTGSKTITVTVVHKDKSEKSFTYKTDEKNLGAVLKTEQLIQGKSSTYGLYITTVDGELADETKEEWWCLTAGGESVMTGVDTTPIQDGDQYELTFMIGY